MKTSAVARWQASVMSWFHIFLMYNKHELISRKEIHLFGARLWPSSLIIFNLLILVSGVTEQTFIRGQSAPRSNPLPFYIPFSTEKVPRSHTLHGQMVLLWIPLNPSQPFQVVLQREMTDFRSLSYTSASEIPTLSGAPRPPPPAWIFVDATRRYRRSDRWVSWPKKWNTSIWQCKNWDSEKDIPIIYYRGLSYPLP